MKDIMGLMKQAQAMQSRMQELQGELELVEVEGQSGGGAVRIVLKTSALRLVPFTFMDLELDFEGPGLRPTTMRSTGFKRVERQGYIDITFPHRGAWKLHGVNVQIGDAAGLAFDALTQARAEGYDVLLIDTAGRLHNKTALMDELRKVVRVIKRVEETAPHSVMLVLDATTGQNAVQQAKIFSEMVDVTGIAVTKLDGSAKGGVVVALAQEFAIPLHMVGVGEKAEDLRPFDAGEFARGLVGL
jgi:hypothetical protein